ncbi:MAG: hypothetical protein MZV64_49185 [Ignavibacteriales bacterium]|nr:hypothetical protein [Ignavibacteriales bacterium]
MQRRRLGTVSLVHALAVIDIKRRKIVHDATIARREGRRDGILFRAGRDAGLRAGPPGALLLPFVVKQLAVLVLPGNVAHYPDWWEIRGYVLQRNPVAG